MSNRTDERIKKLRYPPFSTKYIKDDVDIDVVTDDAFNCFAIGSRVSELDGEST